MMGVFTKREIVAILIGILVACAMTILATVYLLETYVLDRSDDPLSTIHTRNEQKK